MGCDECGATTAWPITLVALKPLSHPDHEGGRHHYEANVDNILEPAGRGVLQMLEYCMLGQSAPAKCWNNTFHLLGDP